MIALVTLFQFTLFVLCSLLASFVIAQKKSAAMAGLFFTIGLHAGFIGLENYYGVKCFDHASALMLLYGPFLYLSVIGILSKKLSMSRSDFWHLLPYGFAMLLWSVGLFSDNTVITLAVFSQGIYIGLSFLQIRRFRLVVSHTKSIVLPDAYQWLNTAVQIFAVTYIFMFVRMGLGFYLAKEITDQLDFAFFIIASSWFSLLIFKGLGSAEFIPTIEAEDEDLSQHLSSNMVHLPNHQHQQVLQKINAFMAEKKPYVDPQITLKEFAEQLRLPARQLSEAINDQYKISFSEFINRARVQETQRLMTAAGWSEHSLLDIALAAGFNSKSSFNLMFKRITGSTPSAYRNSLQMPELVRQSSR
ncbi:AraC family transcriptional regulator [Oceanicoccus sp. KOV_DT_Chl]|uniref:helix-turn-helix domain-containing protein n=1 Tax=Oceanicoccus sp. KOV_DT_Chl TaxID=1904639 RepID=UPI000C7DE9EB|nr:helix-turn-helix domain-containing protein [Oceanicoccus sp. KOV_DT_Chl]